MQLSTFVEYQQRLEDELEGLGISVSYDDDLDALLETYGVATGTGYRQLPFVVERPEDRHPHNFWIALDDGNEPVAMAGFRTLRSPDRLTRVGEAFAQGVLYRQDGPRPEGWWRQAGPMLMPRALYGYIGAGWVHPRFRGGNLAGYMARAAQVEAIVRTKGALAMSTAMTTEPLYKAGMNLRASGLHHMHVEQILEGWFQVTKQENLKLYLSYSTGAELALFYQEELKMLREGAPMPWLRGHDKSHASSVLARRLVVEESQLLDQPVSSMAALLA